MQLLLKGLCKVSGLPGSLLFGLRSKRKTSLNLESVMLLVLQIWLSQLTCHEASKHIQLACSTHTD